MESRQEAAGRIMNLVPKSTVNWGISRCDGTQEELVSYRAGSNEPGWHVKAIPSVGDLLVGTVGHGTGRVIVNVNRVEGVTPRWIKWVNATDVPILPSVGWREVAARVGRNHAPWRRLNGDDASLFIRALADEVSSAVDVPEQEGAQRLTQCRERSRKNRLRKLDAAAGICEGCGHDFRVGFGARGDRALEVHHRDPLRKMEGQVKTRLADLAVLCASCHRLVHADPNLRIESLRAGWARIRSET